MAVHAEDDKPVLRKIRSNGKETDLAVNRRRSAMSPSTAALTMALLASVAMVVWTAVLSVGAEPNAQPVLETRLQARLFVIDGDTVRLAGHSYRLTGFDTPETLFARCETERVLGYRAKQRLSELVQDGWRLEEVPGRRDKYRRKLGRLYIVRPTGERDAGDVLTGEGLARPYDGKTRRQGWCP